MFPLSLQECARILGIDSPGEGIITGVHFDSRHIQPGDLFIALQGEGADGHAYVADALAKGAVAALVSRDVAHGRKQLKVPNVLEAFGQLAHQYRESLTCPIIAVTGSFGKTGTKEALLAALSPLCRTYASHGNYNNHIGVPYSLLYMPRDTECAIIEMGMNHAGEIRSLSHITHPSLAVITAIASVHREFFDSEEGIARAKAEIIEGLDREGLLLLPGNSPYCPLLTEIARHHGITRIYRFGEDAANDYQLLSFQAEGADARYEVRLKDKQYAVHSGVTGRHRALNGLAALAVVHMLGFPVDRAITAMAELKPYKGRGVIHSLTWENGVQVTLMDESYNSHPITLAKAITVLADYAKSASMPSVAIIGDMLELGEDAEAQHVAIAEVLSSAHIDHVITVGPLMEALGNALPSSTHWRHYVSSDLLVPRIEEEIQAMARAHKASHVALLIKGSFGTKMGPLVEKAIALHHERKIG